MHSRKDRAPIYEMLENHAARRMTSFHVPGHKTRAEWPDARAAERYEPLLRLDLTELPDLDDLHHPQGAIEEAQTLAAECFGAEETRLLVGGSTVGNLAMILGVANPGELIIVQRNVHRSVIHALMLAGVRAVLLQPETDPLSGLAVIPGEESVREAVSRYPEAKAVVLSSPNYHGIAADLTSIVQTCHETGIPLFVDEAHGPHFGFHPAFPPSALQAGADIVVQSVHKMLSAMTMGAMLHMQGSLVNRENIRQALRMVQSSSPSFPLLASIDLARKSLHVEGAKRFEPALEARGIILESLPRTTFRAIGSSGRASGKFLQDPLKLALYDCEDRWDGFRLRDALAEQGCAAEMADSRYVLMALGAGSKPEDGERLVQALVRINESINDDHSAHPAVVNRSRMKSETARIEMPAPVLFGRSFRQTERVPLEESVGRTAGEWIVPYPPGIPELYPGERITAEAVRRLRGLQGLGATIQGAGDPGLNVIEVWKL